MPTLRADLLKFHLPMGTCITGTIVLAARSNFEMLRGASVVLYALLLIAWLIVVARTTRSSASDRRPRADPGEYDLDNWTYRAVDI